MHKINRWDRAGSARFGLFRPGSVALKPGDYRKPGDDHTRHRDRFHDPDHNDFHLDDIDNEPG